MIAATTHTELVSRRNQNDSCGITAIVLTYNEEQTIKACLDSLDWVDDVVLVDSLSSDRTVELARRARPDVRVFEHPFQDFGDQRNWALDNTTPAHKWILFLDADERCTPASGAAIKAAVSGGEDLVGYYLCYRNYFLGRWIKRCTHYPSWQLRLLRRGKVRFQKMGHGQSEVTKGQLGHIHEPYDHFGFSKGISEWISRHNRYSSEEVLHVQQLRAEPLRLTDLLSRNSVKRRRCLKRLAARSSFRPLISFTYTYLIRFGFLDGRAGLLFCLLQMTHDIQLGVKLGEHLLIDKQDKCNGRNQRW